MANPADQLSETSEVRSPSRSGTETSKINELLKISKNLQRRKVIIKEVNEDYAQRYKIDVYDDGYLKEPTLKDIEAYNTNPYALPGTWTKGTPGWVQMLDSGQAIFLPDDTLFYLYITEDWEPEHENMIKGKITDWRAGEPHDSIEDEVRIAIYPPFETDPDSIPGNDPIPNVIGAYRQFLKDRTVPFWKYPYEFIVPGNSNHEEYKLIGMAMNYSILPTPKGKWKCLMQMDDDERNIDWDEPRFMGVTLFGS